MYQSYPKSTELECLRIKRYNSRIYENSLKIKESGLSWLIVNSSGICDGCDNISIAAGNRGFLHRLNKTFHLEVNLLSETDSSSVNLFICDSAVFGDAVT